MPTPGERSKLRTLYPEPQKRSGMDARQPTVFKVPVLRLSFLLFFPIFVTIAVSSARMYGGYGDWNSYAVSMIGAFCFVIIAMLASIVMLKYAYGIISRNCVQYWIIEVLYLVILVPFAFIMLFHVPEWFGQVLLWQLFTIEAFILAIASFVTALIARSLSR